jgi:aminoglycoside phosphotransferase
VKYGGGQQRLEILRENRFLKLIGPRREIPECVGMVDEKGVAFLVLQRIPGLPLNAAWQQIGLAATGRILNEALAFLFTPGHTFLHQLTNGVREELDDIQRLLDAQAISVEAFTKASGGRSPRQLFTDISQRIDWDQHTVLTHGDLCLPNIMVLPDETWKLIDWGKSGRGIPARDLASLEGSLDRNGLSELFNAVLERLGLDDTPSLREDLKIYKSIDLFWYHSTPEV